MIACCPSCGYQDAFEDEPCVDCLHEGELYCDCVVRELCDRCALASDFEDEQRRAFRRV